MSRMSNIDLRIKEVREWIEKVIILLITVVLIILIYALDYRETAKENIISNINQRLTQQEHYMHQVQADIDNLYRVVE